MTLQQLKYFLAAAKHGSLSAAADALFVAQPSLSQQIHNLEEELRVQLFVRVSRGLTLTAAGRTLLPHAERAVATALEAAASVSGVRELRGGTAALGMFGNSPFYLLADLVRDFRARFPQVRVRLIGQNSCEVVEYVRSGELEAALVALPVNAKGLDIRPVMRDEVLFASRYAERLRRPMTIERLAELDLILYDAHYGSTDPTRRQLADRAQRAGVAVEPTIELDDVQAALELAADGLGDTMVARGITIDPRFPAGLGTVGFEEPMFDTLAFVTRRGAAVSPATRELLELAERRLAAVSDGILNAPAPIAAAGPPARAPARDAR